MTSKISKLVNSPKIRKSYIFWGRNISNKKTHSLIHYTLREAWYYLFILGGQRNRQCYHKLKIKSISSVRPYLDGIYMRFNFGQNLVSGDCLIDVYMKFYMKHPEMKLIAGVILFRSFWQRWNFISGDEMLGQY